MQKTIKIEGMSCKHCVARVKSALEAVDGVKSAEVDLVSKKAEVKLEKEVSDEVLKGAVTDEGYDVTEIK